ncbi:MAG: hypothetical protein EOP88_11335 [Verrucomicrobiaceae bacterium]|nr:MAG: hypothetical protein EOP88_11335 [Verrucomicrobiaceae bacterium]
MAEIETLALALPEADRAKLALFLLETLRDPLSGDEDELDEVAARMEEAERDPSVWMTHEEFLKAVGRQG